MDQMTGRCCTGQILVAIFVTLAHYSNIYDSAAQLTGCPVAVTVPNSELLLNNSQLRKLV